MERKSKREQFSFLFSRIYSFSFFWNFRLQNPTNTWFFFSGKFRIFSQESHTLLFDEWTWLFIGKGWPTINQGWNSKRHSEKRKVTAKNERFHEQRKVTRENRKGIYSIKWPAIKFCTINECGGRPLILHNK